jgi:PAT family beta-lactamase induction signal transducer AmpG
MTTATARRGLVMSENRVVRLFSFFLLYFGQGLPLGFSQIAFPAWLVANGADEAAVAAVIATAFLPWSFKFIPAALMDRYAYLAMGRRRAWLIAAQVLMLAGIGAAALIAPGPEDLGVILYIVFLIGAGSAIQDVAVDGLAVDILAEDEQGTASAFMFGGQSIGRAVAGAAAGVGLQYYGSQATFLVFLPVILLITVYVIVLRERPGEKRFPWSEGVASPINLERHVGAWWPIFRTTILSLIRADSLKLLGAAALSRSGGGMFTTMWPILGGIGFVGLSTAEYSGMISTVGVAMSIVSIAVGSYLTTRFGARWSSLLVYTTYALLALFVLYAQSIWIATAAFIAMSCVWSMHDTLTSICTNPLRMQLCAPQVAATQFTIYNSLSNLPVSLGAGLFATLGGTAELSTVLWVAAGLLFGGALLYGWMQIGARPRAAPLVPAVD